jgi:uncharacterized membrane protein
MYWLDPDRGRRRRSVALDRATHVARIERELLGKALRDLEHRRQGIAYRARALFRTDEASDIVLGERVRAVLGRYSSHPRSIEVSVTEGVARLAGPTLARETARLLAAVAKVPGIQGVEDKLVRHEQPGNVPGLQGEGLHVPRRRRVLRGDSWMPGVRLVAGALGLAAGTAGLVRRGGVGSALLVGGALLSLRALTNEPVRTLFGQTHDERGDIALEKTIVIESPIETVYAYFRNFENFARFMDHVEEVRVQNSHSSWKVRGPAGRTVDFEVEITRDQPNRLIAWRTRPHDGFEHSGTVRFSPTATGATRLQIEVAYSVPGGKLGNLVAKWFRVDPKTALDEDLLRFKSILERGKTSAHKRQVNREELRPV